MDIADTRKCNEWNLRRLADFLDADAATILGYYDEIVGDESFLAGVNERMAAVRRDYGFTKGIFGREGVDSADWFAFERILLYVLVRHLRPASCLETGVYYGGNTAFILAALARNGSGRLVSIDLPDAVIRLAPEGTHARHPLVGDSELYGRELKPGFIVPEALLGAWELVEGDSLAEIPKRTESFDLYLHDSDHSMDFVLAEFGAAWPHLTPNAVVVVDDIDWSNAFYSICAERQLSPVLFTDNGKDDLRVRTGVVKLDHPRNLVQQITGRAC